MPDWVALPAGKPSQETQKAELAFWVNGGLSRWDQRIAQYERVFRIRSLNYREVSILDVGSGPLSVFEKMAPAQARVKPYDILAEDYNRIAPEKKFPVHSSIPSGRYSLITLFNCLDHMDDPEELLATLKGYMDEKGELWIYCHIDRPFSASEHPQDFRFWRLVQLVERHFAIKMCGLIREGRLFPYAWWGICVKSAGSPRWYRTLVRRAIWTAWCGVLYGGFHGERAAVKLVKRCGLRRVLPAELRF